MDIENFPRLNIAHLPPIGWQTAEHVHRLRLARVFATILLVVAAGALISQRVPSRPFAPGTAASAPGGR